jgi:exonuclease SbcC
VNPLTIHAQNVRTFETLELDLPTGCVVIGGENGAGKSTILNLIDVALFAERGELRPLLSLGEDELQLELVFEHAGETYRVRRMFSGKGAGKTTLDLEQHEGLAGFDGSGPALGERWVPLTRETAIATQAYLEQLLGLSRATFRASSFLAQGDGAAFTDAQPRDRKAILAEILGLEVYDRLQLQARAELRPAEDQIVAHRARIEQLGGEAAALTAWQEGLAVARTELMDALERQAAAEATLEQAVQAQSANAAAVERLLRARAAGEVAKADQERARQAYAAAVQAGVDREQRQAELDQAAELASFVPQLEAELATSREAMQRAVDRQTMIGQAKQRDEANARRAREKNQLLEHTATLESKATHLEQHIGESAECDRCGQNLGAEAATRAAQSYRAEAAQARDEAATRAAEIETEYAAIAELVAQAEAIHYDQAARVPDVIESDLRHARAAGERAAALAEQVRQLAELATTSDERSIELAHAVDRTKEAEAAATLAAGDVGETVHLDAAVTLARSDVGQRAGAIVELRERIAKLEAAEAHAARAADEIRQATFAIETISTQVDVLKLAERAFGRDGIPALIVENAAIPQLEVEANRILGELGGATADCRVELRTQRALKSVEALRETLDIVIVTPTGERLYETFSGGERTRLNLALRIALARLLAHRRGAESRLLAIDEPDGLDAQGMDALARILTGLAGDFDRVLVVSHQPQLATSFDQSIVVVKDGDRSRVDVGVAQAVPA